MNARKLTNYIGACALAIGCTAAVNPAFAQAPAPAPDAQYQKADRDWGWIGLFGLIGLAGLRGRKRDTRYDSTTGATTSR